MHNSRPEDAMPVETAQEISIRRMNAEDATALDRMYATYSPLGGTLGLPPSDPALRAYWLENLSRGINLVAYVDGRLAGHLVLLPTGGALEMVAYVHQQFRRMGVGGALAKAAIEEARTGGFFYVWLLVGKSNLAAQRGLARLGFRVAWQDQREMQFLFPMREPTALATS
jgi:ribosomal protein S18 acetylase RimI-like enzyme